MNHFNKSGLVAVLATAALQLTGCRNTIVIAPGAHCEMEPVEVCHRWRDHEGFWHRECRTEYRKHCWDVAQSLSAPVGPVGLGRDFGVSYDAADSLINVAVDVNHHDFSSAVKLGLTRDDLEQMSSYQVPTDQGIEAVAKNLNQDPSAIRQLFSGILIESRQNAAAKKSN